MNPIVSICLSDDGFGLLATNNIGAAMYVLFAYACIIVSCCCFNHHKLFLVVADDVDVDVFVDVVIDEEEGLRHHRDFAYWYRDRSPFGQLKGKNITKAPHAILAPCIKRAIPIKYVL